MILRHSSGFVYSYPSSIENYPNWSNLGAVTDWGGANLRFFGLVSVGQHGH